MQENDLPQDVNAMLPERSARKTLRGYADYMRRSGRAVFVFQIGANDGYNNDPVYPLVTGYGWRGLLVEPQVDVFERGLTETYKGNERVSLANVAIADRDGSMPFYRLAISEARWATGLSGFRRASIDQHIADGMIARNVALEGKSMPTDMDDLVQVVQVKATTVEALLAKHEVDHIDVLCIDTEGYDFEILKLTTKAKIAPDIVLFESKHLSQADFKAVQSLLSDYCFFADGNDTFAVRQGGTGTSAIRWMDGLGYRLRDGARRPAGMVKRWLRRRGVRV